MSHGDIGKPPVGALGPGVFFYEMVHGGDNLQKTPCSHSYMLDCQVIAMRDDCHHVHRDVLAYKYIYFTTGCGPQPVPTYSIK